MYLVTTRATHGRARIVARKNARRGASLTLALQVRARLRSFAAPSTSILSSESESGESRSRAGGPPPGSLMPHAHARALARGGRGRRRAVCALTWLRKVAATTFDGSMARARSKCARASRRRLASQRSSGPACVSVRVRVCQWRTTFGGLLRGGGDGRAEGMDGPQVVSADVPPRGCAR